MAEKIGIRPATIVIKDNKVLLVKSVYDGKEFYLFPGGGMKFEETIEECAIRETFEETGVKVKIKRLFHVNEYIYANDWNKRSVSMFFIAEPIKILKPITNDGNKIKQIEWIDIKNLRKYDIKPKRVADMIKSPDSLKNIDFEYSVDFKK